TECRTSHRHRRDHAERREQRDERTGEASDPQPRAESTTAGVPGESLEPWIRGHAGTRETCERHGWAIAHRGSAAQNMCPTPTLPRATLDERRMSRRRSETGPARAERQSPREHLRGPYLTR